MKYDNIVQFLRSLQFLFHSIYIHLYSHIGVRNVVLSYHWQHLVVLDMRINMIKYEIVCDIFHRSFPKHSELLHFFQCALSL